MANEDDIGRTRIPEGTLRRLLWSAGTLLAAFVLIAFVVLVARSNHDRDAAIARERNSYDVLVVIRGLDAAMARSEAALGRFVISGDRRTGSLYYDEWRLADAQLDRLAALTRDDPRQAQLVSELGRLYRERGGELAAPATRATYRQGWPALSLFNEAGKSLTIPLIARTLEEIAQNENATLAAVSDAARASVSRSNRLARLLSIVGLLLLGGGGVLGWFTFDAVSGRADARRRAEEEGDRADALGHAVAERTRELVEANARLREEARTRADAEAQLRQVQKMEAVGQLTGGIAHDFNNMLAVVVGGLELARRRLEQETGEVARHIDNAMEGANRAAALTRRLLAFARAESLMPEGIDPARLIAGMSDLIDRTLGERIVVEIVTPADGWQVWCDPGQLENALLNAAVNARDAMDGEGRLTITTADVTLRAHEAGEAPPGDYVRIAVADTGCGMTPRVLERVFEPFFTTKPVGKGTGLGLSQIFGFARQSGGDVAIASAPGAGTTLSLYLPRRHGDAQATPAATVRELQPPRATGPTTILLVEDDARVRAATTAALEELGHHPLPCAGGEEALAMLAREEGVALVVTDVVMPGMTGTALAAEIGARRPDLPILFVTGFAGDGGDADQLRGHEVLRKPFTISALARAIGSALERVPVERAA